MGLSFLNWYKRQPNSPLSCFRLWRLGCFVSGAGLFGLGPLRCLGFGPPGVSSHRWLDSPLLSPPQLDVPFIKFFLIKYYFFCWKTKIKQSIELNLSDPSPNSRKGSVLEIQVSWSYCGTGLEPNNPFSTKSICIRLVKPAFFVIVAKNPSKLAQYQPRSQLSKFWNSYGSSFFLSCNCA